jgi:hypothetical protein
MVLDDDVPPREAVNWLIARGGIDPRTETEMDNVVGLVDRVAQSLRQPTTH